MTFLTSLRPAWPRWSGPLLVLALLSASASLSVAQTGLPPVGAGVSGLPSLGDGAGMTVAEERRLGDRIARDIYRDPDYLDDPVLVDYLQSVWQPLLAAARTRGDVAPELSERLAWELMISRDKRVNAFALPGGYLGVNLGLLAVTERPEELASVLAHELSHVSQRHIARMIATQDRLAPWMLGAMILGALAARSNVDVANAAIAGSQAVAAQSQLNFSRDMEREADRVGFGMLTGAGFDGRGFVSMFDKLQQAGRLNDDGSFPYLRSHPLTGERIADMRARLPLVGAAPVHGPLRQGAAGGAGQLGPSTQLHVLMAARARVLAENSPDRWRDWQQNGSSAAASPGDRYAAAYASLRLGQRAQALALAQRLRGEVELSQRTAVDQLQLEILLSPGAPLTAAELTLRAQLGDKAWAGGSRAGMLLGAQAALASDQPQRASARLLDWVVQHPRDALAWQTLARAQQVQGQTLRAVRAEAESRVAQRDYAGALDRFKAAQALPAVLRAADPIELAIVDSRRREVEVLLREAESEK
ncbi:M48 family metalloprotease [Hydrogenophaga sp.]|uniref:M48 family metalloprotease n=1 Tax=Hydrogenophaga sp. TaxID=1904254 RepID=UPI0025BA028D|nr:M48 family metalloprotease [Hydrogenophaga sp.]